MRKHRNRKHRNLIEVYRTYYRLGIQNMISTSAHAVFTGLLYKFNEMAYPDSLQISIREILYLSGIDVRTFRQARTHLSEYQYYDNNPESWIMRYKENGIREYATYEINFDFFINIYNSVTSLQQDCNNIATELQQDSDNIGENDNLVTTLQQDCNIKCEDEKIKGGVFEAMSAKMPSFHIKDNIIQNNISSSTVESLSSRDRADKDEEEALNKNPMDEKFAEICRLIQKAAPGWAPANDYQIDIIRDIQEYPSEKIRAVIEKAAKSGVKRNSLLQYLEKGLQNYDSLYGGNGNRDYETKKRIEDLQARLKDAREDIDPTHWLLPRWSGPDDPKTWQEVRDKYIAELRERIKYLETAN